MLKRKKQNALRFERLEARALLAASLDCDHNALLPEDTNGSGEVTPVDALVVINELSRSARGVAAESANMADVNADGAATPLDALTIINRLSRVRSGGSAISSVPLEARIERLASDIESGTLPSNLDPTTAVAILEMLKTGEYPEVSEGILEESVIGVVDDSTVDDSMIEEGVVVVIGDDSSVDDSTVDDSTSEEGVVVVIGDDSSSDGSSTDDSSSDDSSSDDSSSDDSSSDDSSSDDSSSDDSSSDDSSSDDSSSDDSSSDDNSSDDNSSDDNSSDDNSSDDNSTDDNSTDEGVTVVADDDCLIDDSDREALTELLTAQFENAGIDSALIPGLVESVLDTLNDNAPWAETGVVWGHASHHGHHHGHHDDPAELIDQLSDLLLDNDDNDPEAVQTLADELTAAIETGDPLTRTEILARIEELGLTLPTSTIATTTAPTSTATAEVASTPATTNRFSGGFGRRFNPRDAFFASFALES
jgi:hypothetical protein